MKTIYKAKDGKLFDEEYYAKEYEEKLFLAWLEKGWQIDLALLLKCECTYFTSQTDSEDVLNSYIKNYWEQHVEMK